ANMSRKDPSKHRERQQYRSLQVPPVNVRLAHSERKETFEHSCVSVIYVKQDNRNGYGLNTYRQEGDGEERDRSLKVARMCALCRDDVVGEEYSELRKKQAVCSDSYR